MKTWDQRKELFKICLYRLTFKRQPVANKSGGGGISKHVQEGIMSGEGQAAKQPN